MSEEHGRRYDLDADSDTEEQVFLPQRSGNAPAEAYDTRRPVHSDVKNGLDCAKYAHRSLCMDVTENKRRDDAPGRERKPAHSQRNKFAWKKPTEAQRPRLAETAPVEERMQNKRSSSKKAPRAQHSSVTSPRKIDYGEKKGKPAAKTQVSSRLPASPQRTRSRTEALRKVPSEPKQKPALVPSLRLAALDGSKVPSGTSAAMSSTAPIPKMSPRDEPVSARNETRQTCWTGIVNDFSQTDARASQSQHGCDVPRGKRERKSRRRRKVDIGAQKMAEWEERRDALGQARRPLRAPPTMDAVTLVSAEKLSGSPPGWLSDVHEKILKQDSIDPHSIFFPSLPSVDAEGIFGVVLTGEDAPRPRWHRDRVELAEIQAYNEATGKLKKWNMRKPLSAGL